MHLNQNIDQANYVLALHSSSDKLGIAVHNLNASSENIEKTTFETGRDLSKALFICINKLLPYNNWKQIKRLAVAIGPGGYTGTRLSIAFARTLAQQLQCQLDGISSFYLMAKRLSKENISIKNNKPFWIISSLKRRGIVGGQYLIQRKALIPYFNEVLELKSPQLLPKDFQISPAIEAREDILLDTIELLKISISAEKNNKESDWNQILPIYPLSPIDNVKLNKTDLKNPGLYQSTH